LASNGFEKGANLHFQLRGQVCFLRPFGFQFFGATQHTHTARAENVALGLRLHLHSVLVLSVCPHKISKSCYSAPRMLVRSFCNTSFLTALGCTWFSIDDLNLMFCAGKTSVFNRFIYDEFGKTSMVRQFSSHVRLVLKSSA
jgi:hypothetical protein